MSSSPISLGSFSHFLSILNGTHDDTALLRDFEVSQNVDDFDLALDPIRRGNPAFAKRALAVSSPENLQAVFRLFEEPARFSLETLEYLLDRDPRMVAKILKDECIADDQILRRIPQPSQKLLMNNSDILLLFQNELNYLIKNHKLQQRLDLHKNFRFIKTILSHEWICWPILSNRGFILNDFHQVMRCLKEDPWLINIFPERIYVSFAYLNASVSYNPEVIPDLVLNSYRDLCLQAQVLASDPGLRSSVHIPHGNSLKTVQLLGDRPFDEIYQQACKDSLKEFIASDFFHLRGDPKAFQKHRDKIPFAWTTKEVRKDLRSVELALMDNFWNLIFASTELQAEYPLPGSNTIRSPLSLYTHDKNILWSGMTPKKIKQCIELNPRVLWCAPDQIRKDLSNLSYLEEFNGLIHLIIGSSMVDDYLNSIDEEQKQEPFLTLTVPTIDDRSAIEKAPYLFLFANSDLKEDKELIIQIMETYLEAYCVADPYLKNNGPFLRELYAKFGVRLRPLLDDEALAQLNMENTASSNISGTPGEPLNFYDPLHILQNTYSSKGADGKYTPNEEIKDCFTDEQLNVFLDLLNISENSSKLESTLSRMFKSKSSLLKMILRVHPDRNPNNPGAVEACRLLNNIKSFFSHNTWN